MSLKELSPGADMQDIEPHSESMLGGPMASRRHRASSNTHKKRFDEVACKIIYLRQLPKCRPCTYTLHEPVHLGVWDPFY